MYLRYRIKFNPEIAKASRGGGRDGALYIVDSAGDPNVFNVKCRASGLWLNSNYGGPDYFWNPDHRWAFVRPRNLLHFSPYLGEFCFKSCPDQPPSILLILSDGTEIFWIIANKAKKY